VIKDWKWVWHGNEGTHFKADLIFSLHM